MKMFIIFFIPDVSSIILFKLLRFFIFIIWPKYFPFSMKNKNSKPIYLVIYLLLTPIFYLFCSIVLFNDEGQGRVKAEYVFKSFIRISQVVCYKINAIFFGFIAVVPKCPNLIT